MMLGQRIRVVSSCATQNLAKTQLQIITWRRSGRRQRASLCRSQCGVVNVWLLLSTYPCAARPNTLRNSSI